MCVYLYSTIYVVLHEYIECTPPTLHAPQTHIMQNIFE